MIKRQRVQRGTPAPRARVHRVQRVHKVQRERFLRLTGLTAGGFLSLTGPLAPRVADCRSAAMLMKSALRIYLSVSYVMIGILLIGSLRLPPPIRLRRTSPRESVSHDSQVASLPYESCSLATPSGGQNKAPQSNPFTQRIAKNKVPPPGGRWWRQPPKGVHFRRPQGGCEGFPTGEARL